MLISTPLYAGSSITSLRLIAELKSIPSMYATNEHVYICGYMDQNWFNIRFSCPNTALAKPVLGCLDGNYP